MKRFITCQRGGKFYQRKRPTYKQKECSCCGQLYYPSGGSQKFCSHCDELKIIDRKIFTQKFYRGRYIKTLVRKERQEMLKVAKSIGHLTELNTIFMIMGISDILVEKRRRKND